MKLFIFPLLFTFLLYGCDKGISPQPETLPRQAGFGGTITFKGTWPSGSVRTHLVVFKNLLQSPGDFSILNLGFVSDSIPQGINEYSYSTLNNPVVPLQAGEYSYIAVAQSRSAALSLERKDWYIIGIYSLNNNSAVPGRVIIPADTFVPGIDIVCDFNSPPPQPPGIMPE